MLILSKPVIYPADTCKNAKMSMKSVSPRDQAGKTGEHKTPQKIITTNGCGNTKIHLSRGTRR